MKTVDQPEVTLPRKKHDEQRHEHLGGRYFLHATTLWET